MGFHVKHARMTRQFLYQIEKCGNNRGWTIAGIKINCIFRFPNGMIQENETVVIDLCLEGNPEKGHPQTFICYLRKPKWGAFPPRYDLEIYRQGEISLPEKYQSRKTGIRWYHTVNPQQDRDFPIILLRENENHIMQEV